MEVSREARIPTDSRVVIRVPPIGSPFIEILRGSNSAFVADGAVLADSVAFSLLEIAQNKLDPLQQKLDSTLSNLQSITDGIRRTVEGQNTQMRRVMNNVEHATVNIAEGTQDLRPTIAQVRALVNNFTTMLDSIKRDENLRQTIANARQFSDTLVASSTQIRSTLATAERTIQAANNWIARIDTVQGALGQMIFDAQTLAELNRTMADLDALIVDIKAHPKKYVHISVFGRRDRQ
jgi:phospholipid/cholesterol/gamma-HCH transport system substrate-binding protein